jgi:hypothetical protein
MKGREQFHVTRDYYYFIKLSVGVKFFKIKKAKESWKKSKTCSVGASLFQKSEYLCSKKAADGWLEYKNSNIKIY